MGRRFYLAQRMRSQQLYKKVNPSGKILRGVEKMGLPMMGEEIDRLEKENRRLRQLLRQAKKMIKLLEVELNKKENEG